MKKFRNQNGYLVLEGLISFFLVTSAVFIYLPMISDLFQQLKMEKVSVEINRKQYENILLKGEEVLDEQKEEGIGVADEQQPKKIQQLSILFH